MILRNATILDFQDISRRPGVDVHLQGNRVKRITPASRPGEPSARAGDEEIDASGLYLIPGLVNTHCHAAGF